MQNKLTEVMIKHIIEQANELKYGKIIIELNDHMNGIDITTQVKERFEKNCK